MSEKKLGENIKRIFFLFFLLFFLVSVHVFKFALFESKNFITNSYNSRLKIIDGKVMRGGIFDRNGAALVKSQKTADSAYRREYLYPLEFAHLIGYTSSARYGIEGGFSMELQKLNFEVFQRIKQVASGQDLHGNSISATVDLDLQIEAHKLLGARKGSVVVMEPSTGKVLAMVSRPVFDTNKLDENYKDLKQNTAENPLLNRASQGLYAPGSIFKVITLAAAIESYPEYSDFSYNCKGSILVQNSFIDCVKKKAHGEIKFEEAVKHSCNGFFVGLSGKVGAEALFKTAEKMFFNKAFGYALESSISKFSAIAPDDLTLLAESSIGQGRVMASPLHMASVFSGIANGGLMMKPYVVDKSVSESGAVVKKYLPERLGIIMDLETAEIIKEAMVQATEGGTGSAAQIDGVKVASKTGTAENPAGADHAWFVSFAPADDPKVCVLLMVENGGFGTSLANDAKELMKTVLAW